MTDLMFVITNKPRGPYGSIRSDVPDAVAATADTALAKPPAYRYPDGTATARAMRDAGCACV